MQLYSAVDLGIFIPTSIPVPRPSIVIGKPGPYLENLGPKLKALGPMTQRRFSCWGMITHIPRPKRDVTPVDQQ